MMSLALIWLLGSATASETCAPVGTTLDAALDAFYDAEPRESLAQVEQATADLSCQTEPISADTLWSLLELEAILALALQESERANDAVIRMVTADPLRLPSANAGAELTSLHAGWIARLARVTVKVRLMGDAPVYLDGREVAPGATVQVVSGPHLVQKREDGQLVTRVQEFFENTTLTSGLVQPAPPPATGASQSDRRATTIGPRRTHTPALWATGVTAIVAGGCATAVAWVAEGDLVEGRFAPPGDTVAQAEALLARGRLINATYATGYALMGVGGALTVTGAVLPSRIALSGAMSPRAMVQARLRF